MSDPPAAPDPRPDLDARSGRRSRWASARCWLLVLPGLAWAAVRATGAERGMLVQLIAFTPYVAAWTLVPAVVALVLRRWPAATVAGLVALTFGFVVLPRALPAGGPTAAGPRIRVLTANLLAGAADPVEMVRLVHDHRVDVLALQELTPRAGDDLDRQGLVDLLPYRQITPEVGTTGSGLYARFPITGAGTRRNEGGFNQAYGRISVPGAVPVRVESVHPAAPYALSVLPSWRTDLRTQPPATPEGEVRILAGDFNATLDHAPLRELLATGYVDAADVAGAGLTGTWGPYDGDPIPRWPSIMCCATGESGWLTPRCTRSRAATIARCWLSCACRSADRCRTRRSWVHPGMTLQSMSRRGVKAMEDRLDPQTTPYQTQRSNPDSGTLGGMPTGAFDPWTYREDAGATGADLVGYKVEATDGGIGKVDSASTDINASYLVVDTGPWIFGKKVMLPAGVVNYVDHAERKLFVDRSKNEIKAAPEFDEAAHADPVYRDKLGGYYSGSAGSTGSNLPPNPPL